MTWKSGMCKLLEYYFKVQFVASKLCDWLHAAGHAESSILKGQGYCHGIFQSGYLLISVIKAP